MKTFALHCLLLAWVTSLSAQEWTRFRGPNGTGISHAKTIPTKLSDADVNWRVELPGVGHSSPVLWGEKLFLTTCDSKAGGLRVLCLNAQSGQLLWRKDFAQQPFTPHKFNNFAAASPSVDAQHVYVIWNETEHFKLAALDHAGKVAWERDFGPFVSQHGCGISPIVHNGLAGLSVSGGRVIVADRDFADAADVYRCHHADTGEVLWEAIFPTHGKLARSEAFHSPTSPLPFRPFPNCIERGHKPT